MGKKSTRSRAPTRQPSPPPSEDDGESEEYVSSLFKKHSDFPFFSDFHEVGFETNDALEMFNTLTARAHKNTLWVSHDLLAKFGCEESITKVFEAIGIDQYVLDAEPSYAPLTNEFLASFSFNSKAEPQSVKFQIWGKTCRITLQTFADILGVPNTGIYDKIASAKDYKNDRIEMWKRLTHNRHASNIYRDSSMNIRNPTLRLICRAILATVIPLPENGHTCPQTVIQLMMDALYSRPQVLSVA